MIELACTQYNSNSPFKLGTVKFATTKFGNRHICAINKRPNRNGRGPFGKGV